MNRAAKALTSLSSLILKRPGKDIKSQWRKVAKFFVSRQKRGTQAGCSGFSIGGLRQIDLYSTESLRRMPLG